VLVAWTVFWCVVAVLVYRWWTRSLIFVEDVRNLSHELPYWTIRDGVVVLRDGSYQYGFELSWPTTMISDEDQIESSARALEQALNHAVAEGERIRFIVEVSRAGDEVAERFAREGEACPDPVLRELHRFRASELKSFCRSGNAFSYRLFATVSFHPQRVAVRKKVPFWRQISVETFRRHLKEVEVRADMLAAHLDSAGFSPRRMSSEEMMALIWRYWNPARRYVVPPPPVPESRERLDFPRALMEAVPEVAEPTVRSEAARSGAVVRRDHLWLDNRYVKVVSMDRLPTGSTWRNIYRAVLDSFHEGWFEVELEHCERGPEIKKLEVKANMLFAVRFGGQREDARASVQSSEVEEALRLAYSSDHRVFLAGVRVVVLEDSYEKAVRTSWNVMRAFHSVPGVSAVNETTALWKSFVAASPLSGIPLHRRCKVFTPNAADFVPVTGAWQGSARPVVVFTHRTGALVPFDPFDPRFPAWNQIVVGSTGSGKTHLANLLLLGLATTGRLVTVVDRGGGYRVLCSALGGQTVRLTPEAEVALNPMDTAPGQVQVTEEGYVRVDELKVAFLTAVVGMMVSRGGQAYTDREQMVVADAVRQTYTRLWGEGRPILLRDLRQTLMVYQPQVDSRELGAELRRVASDLALRMTDWVEDGVFARLFDRPTSVDLYGDRMLYFDTEGLPPESPMVGPAMAIVADVAWRRASREDIAGSVFVWDEAWVFLKIPAAAALIEEMYRRLRRYRGMVLVVTQQPDDLVDSGIGAAILNNSQVWYLLRGTYGDEVLRAMKVGPACRALLGSLVRAQGAFSEVVVLCDTGAGRVGDAVVVRPSSMDYWLATSDRMDREVRSQMIAACGGDVLEAARRLALSSPRGLGLAMVPGQAGEREPAA
jgi:hypothetical protein